MFRIVSALMAGFIFLVPLALSWVTPLNNQLASFLTTSSLPFAQPAQSGGDYAIHVRTSGNYSDDGVILPVFEVLEARYAAANKEFTIEYWFKLPAGYDSTGRELFDHHQPSQEGFWTAFQNGHLWAGIDTESGNDSTAIHLNPFSLSPNFNDGQWHHYALVRDLTASPDQLCLYLDGVGACYLDGSNPNWASVASNIRSAQNRDGDDSYNLPLYAIGGRVTGAGQIEATVDELRISDKARYRTNFTPITGPFAVDLNTVMLFHFDEGSGNKTSGLSSTANLTLDATLVKNFNDFSADPLNPNQANEAAWLNGMWVDGRFGTTTPVPSPASPPLNLTLPNGGEMWQTGSQHVMTWQTSEEGTVAEVNLSYSTDGFATSHTIASAVSNTGVYTWITPFTPSTTVRVRVTDVISPSLYDVSDADFTLTEELYSVYLPVILKKDIP